MRPTTIAWTALRWLYALFFFATGIAVVLHLGWGIGAPPTQPTAAAEALWEAMAASGVIEPMLAAAYLAGGAALAWRRTAPLGIVLLGPVVVGIVVFDIVLAHATAWALGFGAIWAALALRHLAAFRGLWTYDAPDPAPTVAKAAPAR